MAGTTPKAPVTPITVLFADITGSTTLYAQRGDATAFALATACLDLVDARIAAAGGRVVKRLGDGVLAVFDTPAAALAAAAEIRATMDDPAGASAREGLRVRAGIAAGPAVVVPGDVYGDVVNVAARLVGLAVGDEILLAGTVHDGLPPPLRARTRRLDQLLLRNRPAPVDVYELVRDERDATVSAGVRVRASAATMEITHGERRFVLGPQRPRLTIGRDAGSDIRVDDEVVSRTHAEIALRGEKFVLADRSMNGTYVSVENGPLLRVVREEIVLIGAGRIIPGVEPPQPICYRVSAE
jgi:class 3 adenylate cyclase